MLKPLEKLGKPLLALLGILLIGVVGALDYLSGYEFAFSLFYLIPIALVAWFGDSYLGVAMAIVSAAAWLFADVLSGQVYSSPGLYYWNTAVRLGFFLVTTLLLSALRAAMEREKALSRHDYLTGAANWRHFSETLQKEIDRLQRYDHALTLIYFDIDNFKFINDHYGHNQGDQLLKAVVEQLQDHMRRTDVVARLGGDEFAVLMPETGSEGARQAAPKIQQFLLTEMHRHNWGVTFSIGAITCLAPPPAADAVLKMADDLMYSAKKSGKNAIMYSTFGVGRP